jgi:hypothetical protein
MSQAKLLLDEMFSPVIAINLRQRGHDVIAVAERIDFADRSRVDRSAVHQQPGLSAIKTKPSASHCGSGQMARHRCPSGAYHRRLAMTLTLPSSI